MERAAWTDERLDDLAEAMRAGFARIDQDLRDMRIEFRSEIAAVRTEIRELRSAMQRTNLALIVGFLGMIAAIIARGG